MGVLFWVLVVLTWFPAGYLASRLRSAFFGHNVEHRYTEKCHCPIDWNRAVRTDFERKLFAFGFLFGWVALALLLSFLAVGVSMWFGSEIILKKLGELIAPKPK